MPAFATVPIDPTTGAIGKRASGAPLYHRGSRFGPPDRRKLDRNLVARILFAAEALDRRTRTKGQHGGLLKGKGLDVLRALLRRFYSHRDGTCYPSYEAIAEAAGCCRATVRREAERPAGGWASSRRFVGRSLRALPARCTGSDLTSPCRPRTAICSTSPCPIGRSTAISHCRC